MVSYEIKITFFFILGFKNISPDIFGSVVAMLIL
jgi:hypothetical protein